MQAARVVQVQQGGFNAQHMEAPVVALHVQDAPPWHLEADAGEFRLGPEKEKQVVLRGDVLLRQRHDDGRFTELRTAALTYHLGRDLVETGPACYDRHGIPPAAKPPDSTWMCEAGACSCCPRRTRGSPPLSSPRASQPLGLFSRALRAVRLAALAMALWAQAAAGLPEDREQPVVVEADDGIYEPRRGVSVLTGSVRVDQGTLRMQAQTVTLFNADRRLARIVAEGRPNEPATLRQRVHPDEPIVTAPRRPHRLRRGRAAHRALRRRVHAPRRARTLPATSSAYDLKDGRVDARSDQPGGVRMKWQPEIGRSAD